MLKLLIDNGLKINLKGEFGRNAMHMIASITKEWNGGFDDKLSKIALFLVESGAKIDAFDSDKKTPHDLAKMWSNNEYLEFLESQNAV